MSGGLDEFPNSLRVTQPGAAELLARIARIQEEITGIEKLLLPLGLNKSQARKIADLKETCNEVEAQLANGKEANQ